ncbi:MAG: hemerythrin domain-containing protein, partial [Aeromonadaceae bacterium]
MLSLFNWNDGFLTHITSVDEQHRHLVHMINDLSERLLSADELHPDQFISIRDKLFNYVNEHFADEESLMADAKVDGRHRELHLQVHRTFIEDALVLGELCAGISTEKNRELVDYLINWLAY